jgi:outer membrane receptor protein involved in Fe transport
LSPGYYHNYGQSTALTSKAVFGEITYKAIPDLLTFIGGMRFTDDQKTQNDRILLYSTLVPIGTTNENGGIPGTGANAYDSTKQDFQKITGHFTTQYTPKFDFTDQTQIYASYSRGYKAGGANPGIEASNNPFDLPLTYKPEFIDAYEVGTKNQLLNNTLQANGDVYYYDYYGLQVSAIQSNTSINQNINARAWGAEGKFLWQPSDRWQFGLSGAHEESNIVNTQLVDTRNPTGGNPNTLLIKDDTVSGTTGSNCVVYYSGAFPGLPAGFTAPAGGVHALSAYGIPNAAFGSCQPAGLAALTAAGYTYTAANLQGQAVSLNGNELQDTPNLSVSINGQYTQPLGGDYNLVARADAHWQSHFWQRIFEDGADHVGAEYTVDASLQLNAPDNVWYAQVYVKNIFNQNNITGGYLTSSTSGLYTNAFYGDPQTYGITLGAKLN